MLLIYRNIILLQIKEKHATNLHISHYNKSTPITKKQKRKYNINTSPINIPL